MVAVAPPALMPVEVPLPTPVRAVEVAPCTPVTAAFVVANPTESVAVAAVLDAPLAPELVEVTLIVVVELLPAVVAVLGPATDALPVLEVSFCAASGEHAAHTPTSAVLAIQRMWRGAPAICPASSLRAEPSVTP